MGDYSIDLFEYITEEELKADLFAYLEEVKRDKETGLTVDKIRQAYNFSVYVDTLIFRIDRPSTQKELKPVCDIFRFNPETKDISLTLTIDPISEIASQYIGDDPLLMDTSSFSVEFDCEARQYLAFDNVSKQEAHVNNFGGVLTLTREIIQSMYFDVDIYPGLDEYSEDIQHKVLKELKEMYLDAFIRDAEYAWEHREGSLEDCD